jgi:tetraacyldisaccharide-1-P 4'-kinase
VRRRNRRAAARARDRGARAVLVTRKDLVKLHSLAAPDGPPVLALDAATDVTEGREALLRAVLAAGRR